MSQIHYEFTIFFPLVEINSQSGSRKPVTELMIT